MQPTAEHPRLAAVRTLIAEHFSVDPARIVPAASLMDDLDFDEIDICELMMAAEDSFGLTISDAEQAAINTVADLLALLDRHATSPAA